MNTLKESIHTYSKAFIFGKGPTFKNRPKQNDNELYICVNDTLNIIDNCDIFVMNDIETIQRINKTKLKDLKYFLIPEHPHSKEKPSPNITWKQIEEEVKGFFNGTFLVYHLQTMPKKDKTIPTFSSMISGANTAVDLLTFFQPSIQDIEFFGVGIQNNFAYNDIFNQAQNSVYNHKQLLLIRDTIIKTCNKYTIRYSFN